MSHPEIVRKSLGKFGNKRVDQACRKIINGTYVEPDKLVWQYIQEGRIDASQFYKLIDAIKQTVKVV